MVVRKESLLIMERKNHCFLFTLSAIILNLHLCIILNKSLLSFSTDPLYIFRSVKNWFKFHHKFTFHVLCFIHKSHLRIFNFKLKINFKFWYNHIIESLNPFNFSYIYIYIDIFCSTVAGCVETFLNKSPSHNFSQYSFLTLEGLKDLSTEIDSKSCENFWLTSESFFLQQNQPTFSLSQWLVPIGKIIKKNSFSTQLSTSTCHFNHSLYFLFVGYI